LIWGCDLKKKRFLGVLRLEGNFFKEINVFGLILTFLVISLDYRGMFLHSKLMVKGNRKL
jgi:hypothetical protein